MLDRQVFGMAWLQRRAPLERSPSSTNALGVTKAKDRAPPEVAPGGTDKINAVIVLMGSNFLPERRIEQLQMCLACKGRWIELHDEALMKAQMLLERPG